MTKIALLFAGAAALALGACGDTDDGADETTVVETETVEPAPDVTTTTVVEDDGVDVVEDVDGDDDVSVEVDEDGASVEAEIE